MTSREFVVSLAASRPKKLVPLAKKLVRSTCSKSKWPWASILTSILRSEKAMRICRCLCCACYSYENKRLSLLNVSCLLNFPSCTPKIKYLNTLSVPGVWSPQEHGRVNRDILGAPYTTYLHRWSTRICSIRHLGYILRPFALKHDQQSFRHK